MIKIEWFAYCFPNRRTDKTVVEITLDFGPVIPHSFPQHASDIKEILVSSGILTRDETFPEHSLPDDRMDWYTSLLAQTALLFQRKAGHRVSFYSVARCQDQDRRIALLEHEHCDVGMTAVKLAVELIQGERKLLAEPFRIFEKFAQDRLLPIDTEAIIKAARCRDIPSIQLERQPYKREDFEKLTGGNCIRRNGLLMLGHGEHQHVLDGTFCLDLSAEFEDLLTNPAKRQALMENQKVPIINSSDDRMRGANKYYLIAVNGQVTAIVSQSREQHVLQENLDSSLIDQVFKINREVGFAPIVVTVLTADILQPLAQTGGGVLDFELAPELDRYLDQNDSRCSLLMDLTADMIIDWLFGKRSCARMPVIAVTGTNGKTTTTRMINHILMSAGRKPGMVCSEGVSLNGQMISQGDQCTDTGHLKVLTSKAVEIAVLETHHAGILARGFAFEWCDIAICLNVTEDHLGVANVDTVEQMASVKQALPERARQAVVLNADDPYCLAMLGSMVAEKICLVSMQYDVDELRALVGKGSSCFCLLELIGDEEWLVIHDRGQRMPLVNVCSIPATFDGVARFNISNAMHAALATYQIGTGIDMIRTAMCRFIASYESTPGRMNIFDDLPFRIIMDFAHNPDGVQKFCEFVEQQTVTGRKVIAFAGVPNRTDQTLKNMAHCVAGHFDFYFCKEYVPIKKNQPRRVAHILQQGLLEAGVAESRIAIRVYGKEVIFEIFDSCEPGDLLVMLLGKVEIHHLPGYITEYAAGLLPLVTH